jgi:hypothetical protein
VLGACEDRGDSNNDFDKKKVTNDFNNGSHSTCTCARIALHIE